MSYTESELIEQKKVKLKRMRFIATGLLVIMAVIYIVFKRYENRGLIFSSIAAFSEASMIGALADWFAVVALFRHPLGLSWIPHTAIIQKNKDKIGESLSSFVVSNFFSEEIIKGKLKEIKLTEKVTSYVRYNKRSLSVKIIEYLPYLADVTCKNEKIYDLAHSVIKRALRDIDVNPYVTELAENFIASGSYKRIVTNSLNKLRLWVSTNKDQTIRMLGGINKTLTLPFVDDMVYKSIVKTLERLAEEAENGDDTEFNTYILKSLPEKIINDIVNSNEARAKLVQYKENIIDSQGLNTLIDNKILELKDSITAYARESDSALVFVEHLIDTFLESILNSSLIQNEIENSIKEAAVELILSYRENIRELISETVDNWPINDAVEKLETQVGGDLQYIRINGTVVGGIAGLLIHLISYLL